METSTRIHRLDNGLVLLGEETSWKESVAYSLLIPCGTIDDPDQREGLSGLVTELAARGAGAYDNRALLAAFENLGAETSESVSQSYSIYRASALAEKFSDVLALTADMVLRPRFPAEELEPAQSVLLQEIASLEDEPSRKMMVELGRIFFPAPWGRPSFGTVEGLTSSTLDEVIAHHGRFFSPQGAVLGVAGRFDWEKVCEEVERLFGDWRGDERPLSRRDDTGTYVSHIPFESAQTHIGLAWPSVPAIDPDYPAVRSALGILSGGMSSRFFTEVREKRGLCYTVYASYYTHKNDGAVFCYCGSGADTAQEALDVMIAELHRLETEGVTPDELQRMKTRAKSEIVFGLESTGARAGGMVRDWYYLGRVRTMSQMQAEIDSLDVETVSAAIKKHPPRPLRLVTLGPKPLKIDSTLLG